jgi:predicted acylesterase/phospholipase RssA
VTLNAPTTPEVGVDLLLSSGFLAFARHIGFLEAMDASPYTIDAMGGTSSGALVGAMYASGLPLEEISALLSAHRPVHYIRLRGWRGLFTLRPMIEFMRTHLPARIEDLQIPFGVGVVDLSRNYHLLTSGPLPELIAASCAVPYLFQPIRVDNRVYQDGGFGDRVGFSPWRALRSNTRVIVHQVRRTKGRDTPLSSPLGPPPVVVADTPRSGANLWSLGPFQDQREEARSITEVALTVERSSREDDPR